MSDIGSLGDAQRAFDGHLPYLDEGGYRNVFIDFNNEIIYKVENDEGILDGSNKREKMNYLSLSTRNLLTSPYVIVPPMSFYDVEGPNGSVLINAAKFINGRIMQACPCDYSYSDPEHDSLCLPPEVLNAIYNVEIGDMGYGNVIFSSGAYFVVDLDV